MWPVLSACSSPSFLFLKSGDAPAAVYICEMRTRLTLFLFMAILVSSCGEKQNENCNNPDAVNYDAEGALEKNCIFPSDKVKGIWGIKVLECPLIPSQVGEIYLIELRDAYCYGPEKSYKYVQLFSMQSPLSPSDFCLFLNGFSFEFDSAMHTTWSAEYLTGSGSFANDKFLFEGTLHRPNGDWPIKLGGEKS